MQSLGMKTKQSQDILPTQTKLFDKGISHTFSCLWCRDVVETVDHLLWRCDFAQRIRKDCPVGLPVSYSPQMSFKGFLASCFVIDLSSLAMEVAFTKEWAMWKAKNDLMWEEKVSTVSDICQ
jgi:hypothetical protein